MEIKKAIIPAAGLGTRFLPLTKNQPKEMLPLVDSPLISYVVKEAKESGIDQINLILSDEKKVIMDYFKKKSKCENFLKKRNQKDRLDIIQREQDYFSKITFSQSIQSIPKGDGDAVLRAKKNIGKSPFAVLFPDDIFFGKQPALKELIKVFSTSQKPVIGLKRVTKDKLSSYGVAKVEKIAHKIYKIKGIVEKPEKGKEPSDLAFCGRYVFTVEIFNYLSKTKPNKKGEVIIAEALNQMLKDGKTIYGVEIEEKWLECGKTIDWIKSNLFLTAQHPEYGPIIKEYLKTFKRKT